MSARLSLAVLLSGDSFSYNTHPLTILQTIAPSLDVTCIRDSVLDCALRLSTDEIPNIRFNVAKALEILGQSLISQQGKSVEQGTEGRQLVQDKVVPALNKMAEDTDADVRYFAAKALERTHADVGEPMSGEWGKLSEWVLMVS